jgi:hypothetical protein
MTVHNLDRAHRCCYTLTGVNTYSLVIIGDTYMRVKVFLHEYLKKLKKQNDAGHDIVFVEENAKIEDLLNYYGFTTDEVGVIIQNQKLAKWDDLLIADAEIHLYPLLEGG